MSILVSGTALAQLVTIGFQIVLRRVFSPDDFGAFAVYMSVVGIVLTIASLRLEQTILLPKENLDGLKLTKLSVLVAFFSILIFAFALYLFSNWFMNLVGLNHDYKTWLVYLPITIFLFSVYQAINYYLIRINNYKVSGSNKVVRRVAEGSIQSFFGYMGKGVGLIFGDIIAHLVIIARGVFKIWQSGLPPDSKEKEHTYKQLIHRYQAFPLKNTIPALLNALSRLLPIIIISRLFTSEITGYFDLARVVLIIPMSLITVSLNQVFVQQFSSKRNLGQSIKKEGSAMFLGLIAFAVLFVIVIKAFGVPLFQIIFGDQWAVSGQYAEILVWAFALKFAIAPFNASFTAFEKIGIGSIWQTGYFLLVASMFFIDFDSITYFLQYYVIIEIVAYSAVGIINFIILYRYEKQLKC